MAVKSIALLIALLGLASCAGSKDALIVKQFQLRDQSQDQGSEPMVRMEKSRRLHGAVSMEERRQRLGQYYTLIWNDSKGINRAPVVVVFEYRQGRTGSLVKTRKESFPASASHGVAEFSVIGDNYFDNGKVLAWRATVKRGGQVIGQKQSYLWD